MQMEPMKETSRAFVLILTWNRWDVTIDCLRSVLDMTYANFDVLVVDNASQDGTPECVARIFPNVRVIENERNLGFAAGCNVGLRYALAHGADYILLLNNDTVVDPCLLTYLIGWTDAHPEAGLVMPTIFCFDMPNRIWSIGGRRHRLTLDVVPMATWKPPPKEEEQGRVVDYIYGTAMLIRRTVLEEVGLFDEAFFMYYEDLDLCLRTQRAGFAIYHVPGVAVWHREAASTRRDAALRYYHKARSSAYFFRKHAIGLCRPIIALYRLGSALCTVGRLLHARQLEAVRAYLQGLSDGLQIGPGSCQPGCCGLGDKS
jgi:GT2 family glycosyltransferase